MAVIRDRIRLSATLPIGSPSRESEMDDSNMVYVASADLSLIQKQSQFAGAAAAGKLFISNMQNRNSYMVGASNSMSKDMARVFTDHYGAMMSPGGSSSTHMTNASSFTNPSELLMPYASSQTYQPAGAQHHNSQQYNNMNTNNNTNNNTNTHNSQHWGSYR